MSDKKAEYHECKRIDELLAKNGTKHDAGYAYNEGSSDERIAKEVGVKETSVANFRRKYYGKHAPLPVPVTDIEARMAQLEADMANLRERMADVEGARSRSETIKKTFAPFPG